MIDLTTAELPTISDGEFAVRPWLPGDAPALAAMCDDPDVARWIPVPVPYTLADAEEWIGDAARKWTEEHSAQVAVVRAATDEPVGSVGMGVAADTGSAEIGYLVKASARRSGVAAAAVRLLAAWGLDDLGLGRIQIRCAPSNDGSRRTALRCGFVYEGTMRSENLVRDRRDDSMVFSLLPTDPRPW